ncbi:MAG: hypothetical protein A2240_00060 [Candidatus Jacksonbacteria bacterium RIFOXYA2_FULL_43_12]|nr:MAG: hypothetical protein A2240_00060 [Candidatus Jacksonbacteria bacterium RIFOXYA2_FULL_43_12]
MLETPSYIPPEALVNKPTEEQVKPIETAAVSPVEVVAGQPLQQAETAKSPEEQRAAEEEVVKRKWEVFYSEARREGEGEKVRKQLERNELDLEWSKKAYERNLAEQNRLSEKKERLEAEAIILDSQRVILEFVKIANTKEGLELVVEGVNVQGKERDAVADKLMSLQETQQTDYKPESLRLDKPVQQTLEVIKKRELQIKIEIGTIDLEIADLKDDEGFEESIIQLSKEGVALRESLIKFEAEQRIRDQHQQEYIDAKAEFDQKWPVKYVKL